MAIDKYMLASKPVSWYENARYDLEVNGIENIPTEGGAILAANHLLLDDSILTSSVIADRLGRQVVFGAKKQYFEGEISAFGRTFRHPRRYIFEEITQSIPVDRLGGPRAILAFNNAAADVLRDGNLLALHGEGTRSIDGRLYNLRQGISHIALKSSAIIVPTAHEYGEPTIEKILNTPFGQPIALRRMAKLSFGEPITPEMYKGMKPRELSILLRDRIQELSGQELAGIEATIQSK